jgi:hypothetical protein
MTYNEFKAEYLATFTKMMSYSPNEIGSVVYANKMADLADMNPTWAERAENESKEEM